MSVIVKGMEMPDSCDKCRLCRRQTMPTLQGIYEIECAAKNATWITTHIGDAPMPKKDWCPLEEVPESLIPEEKPEEEQEQEQEQEHDAVNHPSHYTDGKIEVIDYIEDKHFPYHLGNAIKYISRAGKKDPDKTIEDLKKADWYVNRYIQFIEKHKEDNATCRV